VKIFRDKAAHLSKHTQNFGLLSRGKGPRFMHRHVPPPSPNPKKKKKKSDSPMEKQTRSTTLLVLLFVSEPGSNIGSISRSLKIFHYNLKVQQ